MPTNPTALAIANLKSGVNAGFPGFSLPGADNAIRLPGGDRSADVAQVGQTPQRVNDAMTAGSSGSQVQIGGGDDSAGAGQASQFNNDGQTIVDAPTSPPGGAPTAGRGPLTVDPGLGTRANPVSSIFSAPHGGYIPAGVSTFSGQASKFPTIWTNDAGLGWVPRAGRVAYGQGIEFGAGDYGNAPNQATFGDDNSSQDQAVLAASTHR